MNLLVTLNLEKGIYIVNIDGIKKNINKYIEEKGI